MPRLKDLGKVKDAFLIELKNIEPGENVRECFETVPMLANSLVLEGQLTPIEVRLYNCHAVITDGERRYKAAIYANENLGANIEALWCVAEPKGVTTIDRIFRQLVHNDEVEKLRPIDRARAYKRLVEEYNLNASEIAKRVGRSRQHISDMLALLEAPEDIQDAVEKGAISSTAAVKTAKARKEIQDEVREKLEAGGHVNVKDLEVDEDGLPKTISASKIRDYIKIVERRMKKCDQRATEYARWESIKYGMEICLGMHEL